MSCATVPAPRESAPSVLPAQFVNSGAFVQGRIGDAAPAWFLLDTGASLSALDEKVAKSLALKPAGGTSVQGSAGTIEASAVKVPRLCLGDACASDMQPTVYDLSGSLAPAGQTVAGILGYDMMEHFAVLFDPAGSRVVLAKEAAALADLSGAEIIPFTLDNNIPLIRARIDGTEVPLRLDTGASLDPGDETYVNVTEGVYEQLKKADPSLVPAKYFTASGAGGTIRIPVVPAHSFTLGARTFEKPILIVQPRTGYFAEPDAVGFLGAYALKSSRGFIVDYPRKRLILLR